MTRDRVEETYAYDGLGGGVSDKWTRYGGGGPFHYAQSYSYDELGNLSELTYPACVAGSACPGTPEPARTITYSYDQGLLEQVVGFTQDLSFHADGNWAQLPHVNGVSDFLTLDPVAPLRPNRFHSAGPTGTLWDSGVFQYDGAGNIKAMGSEQYAYDAVSRITEATAEGESQEYSYDTFGNLTQVIHTDSAGTPTTRSIDVTAATNRLSSATYDAAGAVTAWGGSTYSYDALGMLSQVNGGEWAYVYDAEDRRVAILRGTTHTDKEELYSLRAPNGKILREFEVLGPNEAGNRYWRKDFIYRGSSLLATIDRQGESHHFHLDRLGSPRLITDDSGSVVARHTYFPYGEERTDPTQSDEELKFTGHQRDPNGAGSQDDLDYMLARNYSPHLGRFLQVDPSKGNPERPQSLNRYCYALGNPLLYVDPDGRNPQCPVPGQWCEIVNVVGKAPKQTEWQPWMRFGFRDMDGNEPPEYLPKVASFDGVIPDRFWTDWDWAEQYLEVFACLYGATGSTSFNPDRSEWGIYAYRNPESGRVVFSSPIRGGVDSILLSVPEHIRTQNLLLFAVHSHGIGGDDAPSFSDGPNDASDALWAQSHGVPLFVAGEVIGMVSPGMNVPGGLGRFGNALTRGYGALGGGSNYWGHHAKNCDSYGLGY